MGVVKRTTISLGKSVKLLLAYHWYAIFVAIIVACIAGLPQIIVRDALGTADNGIPYLANDAEGEYLARIQDILDGHWSASSPVLYEYKDASAMIPPTGEFIFYALPVKLTGLSLSTVVFLSKFLYPALLFLFAYLFILSLLNKSDEGARLSAIAGALLIVIGYDAYDYRNFISYIMHGVQGQAGLLWNRLVNPITGAILLFFFLWLLSRTVKGKSGWLTVAASGLVLAIMSGYIFSFALALSVAVLMGFYFVWRKNWQTTFRIYTSVAIALALNSVYFAGVFLAMQGTESLSDPQKSGMFLTHEPLINLVALAALIGVAVSFILFYKTDISDEREKRWWFLALAAVIASELVYNQQLITGKTVWPQHFVQYTKPLSMALMAVFLHNIVRTRATKIWRVATAFLVIIAALFGWRGFEAAVQNTIPRYAELQSFSGVFNYLNAHAEKDCVVYVSSDYGNEINRFIPAFTSCNTYHSFYIYNGVPSERVMHNFLVNLRLRGINPKDVESHFNDNGFWTRGYFFRSYGDMFCCEEKWLKKFGDKEEIDRWFVSVEKDVEQRYAQYLKGGLYSELTRYRIDYFVVDTVEQPQVDEERYPFLSFKEQFDRFAVYAVIKPSDIVF